MFCSQESDSLASRRFFNGVTISLGGDSETNTSKMNIELLVQHWKQICIFQVQNYKPATGESLSSLMACRSHRFLALCCCITGGVTSATSAGGVLLVIRLAFFGGLFRSLPGVLGGEALLSSSCSKSFPPLKSPIIVDATRTKLSNDGAATKVGL